jgi:hypothetical protein
MLKGYLFSLLADGSLSDLKSPTAIVKKTISMIKEDLPVVAGEVTQVVAGNLFERGAEIGISWARNVATDIRTKGAGAVLRDLGIQHDRGVSVAAKRRR